MTDFASILSKRPEDIEKPKPLPEGMYLWSVASFKFDKTTGEKKTDYCEFTVRCLSAEEVEDRSALPENLQAETNRITFYLTDKAAYRLKDFVLETLQIESNGRVLGECLPDTVNKNFRGSIKHVLSKDGKATYANIDETFPA